MALGLWIGKESSEEYNKRKYVLEQIFNQE